MRSQHLMFLLSLFALVSILGCSRGPSKPPNFPKLYPISITVTQESQPLEGANVRLYPQSGESEWTISAKTNEKGIAKIHTYVHFPGAPEGTFKVVISKIEITPSVFKPDGSPPDTPPEKGTPEYENFLRGYEREIRPNYDLVDTLYGNKKTTPLEITIQKGKNAETYEVGPAIRKKK